jgi:aquaporin Z
MAGIGAVASATAVYNRRPAEALTGAPDNNWPCANRTFQDRGTGMFRKLSAEAFGTFWLVFGGCGSALIAAAFPEVGIGFVGVALAFGLTVLTMVYAVGGISGGHFNPAVSLGLAVAGRFEYRELIPYWIAQVVGGVVAAALLYLICSGKAGWMPGSFASNGYDANSPDGYSMLSALLIEIVLTAFFILIILGSTSMAAPVGFAPIAIGLGLTLIHLISIPVTNTSVNPARSIAAALFAQNGALGQLWLFILAPLLGGALGAAIWKYVLSPGESLAGVARE